MSTILLKAFAAAAAVLIAVGTAAGAGDGGRGFGDGKSQRPEDLALLAGPSWWYDWGLEPSGAAPAAGGSGQEFVAMAWGKAPDGVPLELALQRWAPHPTTKHLLGFNEPNLRSQSNLSAAEACKLWPVMVAAAKSHGLKLGSPAANHCTPGGTGTQDPNCYMNSTSWFDLFFSLCGADTVDFVTTHKYGCNASSTIECVPLAAPLRAAVPATAAAAAITA